MTARADPEELVRYHVEQRLDEPNGLKRVPIGAGLRYHRRTVVVSTNLEGGERGPVSPSGWHHETVEVA